MQELVTQIALLQQSLNQHITESRALGEKRSEELAAMRDDIHDIKTDLKTLKDDYTSSTETGKTGVAEMARKAYERVNLLIVSLLLGGGGTAAVATDTPQRVAEAVKRVI